MDKVWENKTLITKKLTVPMMDHVAISQCSLVANAHRIMICQINSVHQDYLDKTGRMKRMVMSNHQRRKKEKMSWAKRNTPTTTTEARKASLRSQTTITQTIQRLNPAENLKHKQTLSVNKMNRKVGSSWTEKICEVWLNLGCKLMVIIT